MSRQQLCRHGGASSRFFGQLNSGTEIELTTPAAIAYLKASFATARCPPERKINVIMGGLVRILTADDHAFFREALAIVLATQPDMKLVAEASNVPEAIRLFREH